MAMVMLMFLYAGDSGDLLGVLVNDGSENFTNLEIMVEDYSITDIEVSDLDNDGDLDIFTTVYSGDYKIVWYRNDGALQFTVNYVDVTHYGPVDIEVVDLDGDNDKDFVVAFSFSGEVVWFDNDGSESFTEKDIAENMEYTREVSVLDLDNDGDLDILSASEGEDKVYWHQNNGSETFITNIIDGDLDGAWSVDGANLDNDGDIDVVATSLYDDKVVWYENDGLESFTPHELAFTDQPDVLELVDIDIDGFIDIVTVDTPTLDLKKIIWYKNDLNQSFTKYNLFVGSDYFYSPSHVKTVDINNDGLIDLVSSSHQSNFNFFTSK